MALQERVIGVFIKGQIDLDKRSDSTGGNMKYQEESIHAHHLVGTARLCFHPRSVPLSFLSGDVYMCSDCGVLFNMDDPRNYNVDAGEEYLLSPAALTRLIVEAIETRTEYLEQIRHVITDYDTNVPPLPEIE